MGTNEADMFSTIFSGGVSSALGGAAGSSGYGDETPLADADADVGGGSETSVENLEELSEATNMLVRFLLFGVRGWGGERVEGVMGVAVALDVG
jgi:hypothetical protein